MMIHHSMLSGGITVYTYLYGPLKFHFLILPSFAIISDEVLSLVHCPADL